MNKQQKEILEAYQNKNKRAQFLHKQRIQKLEAEIPELVRLSEKQAALGVEQIKKGNDPQSRQQYQKKYRRLEEKKVKLLTERGYSPKWLAPDYDCAQCEDTGYIGSEMCTCLADALKEAAFSGFDLSHYVRHQNFDTFDLTLFEDTSGAKSLRKRMAAIKSKMQHYAQNFDRSEESFLFTGQPGVGKTFTSNCIANVLIENGHPIVYTTVSGLMHYIKTQLYDMGESHDAVYRPLHEADLLILDDFGAESPSEFNRSQVFELINHRILTGQKTIISTNLTMQDLINRYEQRLTSRIRGHFTQIVFEGPDLRTKL
ncbi:MAG: ATP-binding protein [Eubacteriaceae bacterium]|jgi:DNA replication protein DnaC|nr:ATP-binding protein [Eubacteriaceae bacterium]